MPEGYINYVTDLQNTKFLRLSGLKMCDIKVHTPK